MIHANHPRELTPQAREAHNPAQPRRHPALVANRPVARRQRRCGRAGGPVSRSRRDAGQALLPPPCRSCPRHRAFPHRHRGWPASRSLAPRPRLRAVPADLCPRYSRGLRQGADRPLRGFRREGKQAGGTSKTEPGCSTPTLPIRRAEEPAVTEPGDPVMIVVGGGAIALSTTQELCALQGHRVVVLWRRDPDFTRAVEGIGAVHIAAARPDSTEALDRAGVRHAVTILALSPDDQLNLHAALLARDANPRIRIVLRQFNRTLAHKIEQNLPNCSVLSLAWHSAATYAAAGIDPSCFRGLQFPERDGPLTGFATRVAESCGVGGETVGRRGAGARRPHPCGRRQDRVRPRHRPRGPGRAGRIWRRRRAAEQRASPADDANPPSAQPKAALAVASRPAPPASAQSDPRPPRTGRARRVSRSALGTSTQSSKAVGSTPSISWSRQ